MNLRQYPPALRQLRHSHDVASVTLVRWGEVLETSAAGTVHATAGTVLIKPAGFAHEDVYGPAGAAVMSIDAPDGLPYRWIAHGVVVRTMFRLLLGEVRIDDAVSEIAAAMDGEPREAGSRAARAAAEALDAHACDGISIAAIAAMLSVHPVALARSFRRRFGCTMTRYAMRVRLRRAAHLLASGSAPIAGVAIESGFADQSHLCRAMREAFGLTPRAFRDAARFDPFKIPPRPARTLEA